MKQDLPFAHIGILILLLLIAINLFILDLKIFYPDNVLFAQLKTTSAVPTAPIIETTNRLSCPASCIEEINKVTENARIGIPTTVPPLPNLQINKTDKEFFIPLGTGATTKNDWENLVGTETVINPSTYGTFREALLIVSLKNTTQNGQAETRLYNVTDNYAVFGSHIIMNGPIEQTITSQKFALPQGSKLYRVQLKSTLSYPVSLDNARLKIIAQ